MRNAQDNRWCDIPGYEGLYKCSTQGQILSLERVVTRRDGIQKTIAERYLTPIAHNHGYKSVTLCKNGKRQKWLVHRIVALTFLPNPANLPCINHKNQDKADNRVENLEWCTVAYNNTYGDKVQRSAEKHRGHRHSLETKRRMSEAHKNISEETRQKLSLAHIGKRHSDESKRHVSEFAKTRKRDSNGRWLCEIHAIPIPAEWD